MVEKPLLSICIGSMKDPWYYLRQFCLQQKDHCYTYFYHRIAGSLSNDIGGRPFHAPNSYLPALFLHRNLSWLSPTFIRVLFVINALFFLILILKIYRRNLTLTYFSALFVWLYWIKEQKTDDWTNFHKKPWLFSICIPIDLEVINAIIYTGFTLDFMTDFVNIIETAWKIKNLEFDSSIIMFLKPHAVGPHPLVWSFKIKFSIRS